jgi:hypothetical protein
MSSRIYPVGSVHRSRDLWEELPREDCGMFVSRLGAAKALFIPLIFNGALGFVGWLLWELSR